MSRVIASPNAPPAVGHYSQARVATPGQMLWTSGQVAQDPKGGPTPEGVYEQTVMALGNLNGILLEAGFERTDVVQCLVYIDSMDNFSEFNRAYAEFFGDHKPCRCTTQSAGMCAPFKVEIVATACKCA